MIGYLVVPSLPVEVERRRHALPPGSPLMLCTSGRITALSPEAERVGLRRWMTPGQAQLICPDLQQLPADEEAYRTEFTRVLDHCLAYVPALEPAGLVECFLDLHGQRAAEALGEIERTIRSELGFAGVLGAGANKLIAKAAAQERSGTVVAAGEEAAFLAPRPVARLWPLEEKVAGRLETLGLHTIGQLQQIPPATLAAHFGAFGTRLREMACGVDREPLRALYPPEAQEARLASAEGMPPMAALETLSAQVAQRLHDRQQTCRHLALDLEPERGEAVRLQARLSHPLAEAPALCRAAARLVSCSTDHAIPSGPPLTGRGQVGNLSHGLLVAVTLRVSELERRGPVQWSLLEPPARGRSMERLRQAMQFVRTRFGEAGARWARELEIPRRERVLAALLRRP
jgi:DNA polymerase-4